MAASLRERAERRAVAEYGPQIKAALAAGNGQLALNLTLRYLQGEAAKGRRRRPADWALVDAELAGRITLIAASLPRRLPRRPPGCPPAPGADDLLATFAWAMKDAVDKEEQA